MHRQLRFDFKFKSTEAGKRTAAQTTAEPGGLPREQGFCTAKDLVLHRVRG